VLVLALDTTSRSGSAAVVRDSELLGEIVGDDSRNHAERLPGELMRVLQMAAVPLEAIDLLGIAAMQGLAMATNRKIVPVSALDALAVAGRDPDADASATVAAWIDAQRGQVFASLYDAAGIRTVREPSSLTPMQTLDMWEHALSGAAVRFIGDGAARYEVVIRERLGSGARILSTPRLAGIVGRLAAAAPASALLPHAIVPIYIRRPDVELARSRQADERR
jgi:tRNA threonylcarbamoyladenosine biosynthesis protein TsaB